MKIDVYSGYASVFLIVSEEHSQKICESASNLFQFDSDNCYCHPADGVFVTNIIQSHVIHPSLFAEVA